MGRMSGNYAFCVITDPDLDPTSTEVLRRTRQSIGMHGIEDLDLMQVLGELDDSIPDVPKNSSRVAAVYPNGKGLVVDIIAASGGDVYSLVKRFPTGQDGSRTETIPLIGGICRAAEAAERALLMGAYNL